MGFLEDAEAFMKAHPRVIDERDYLHLETKEQQDNMFEQLRETYDQATDTEIRRALEDAIDRYSTHPPKKDFFDFLRCKLED